MLRCYVPSRRRQRRRGGFTGRLRYQLTLTADSERRCRMPDTPIAGSGGQDYPADMEARVRVLEEIAGGVKALLGDIRSEQRELRSELRTELRAMRADIGAVDQRRERDFRITFGAIITTALGLAFL